MSNARELAELGGSYGTGGSVGMKNRIINGAMMIDQRNAGASVTATTGVEYTVDRWRTFFSQLSKFTIQRNAGGVTPPTGFSNYFGITSLSAYAVTSTDYNFIAQPIEGFNVADFGWGAAGAQTITLSFWVRSSLTGTFSGSIRTSSGTTRSYVFTYTISSANTWEYKTITIAGDTSGTWPTTNTAWGTLSFCIGSGSTRLGTAGSWQTADLDGVTGTTSVVGTNGATFYITGVQLEKGSTATSFDYRPYGTELALCQRYYIQYAASSVLGTGSVGSGGTVSCYAVAMPVEMRSGPTLTYSTLGIDWGSAQVSTSIAVSTAAILNTATKNVNIYVTHAATGTSAFVAALLFTKGGGYLGLSSEL